MYDQTSPTPLGGFFIPTADLPHVSTVENQATSSQAQTMHVGGLDWSAPLDVGGLPAVATGDIPESALGYGASQAAAAPSNVVATGFPPVAAPTCGLVGGEQCTLALEGSARSIKAHLRMHGHRHPQRKVVRCPWVGCSSSLQWMNVARHIKSVHLHVRFRCFDCDKTYSRPEGLAMHTTSMRCSGATVTHAGG